MRFQIILSLILFFVSSQYSLAGKSEISVVAKIDNQIITNLDLMDRYNFLLAISEISIDSKKEKLLLLNQLLQKMIDEKLQLGEARSLELSMSAGQLDEAVKKVAIGQGRDFNEFREFFNKKALSYPNYLLQLKSQILWNKVITKVVSPRVKVSEIEVKELLELKKIKAHSLKLFLAEIYIPFDYQFNNEKIDAQDLAIKLVDELRKKKKSGKYGANFSNIAEQFSRSATAEFGGEIGWVGQSDIDTKIYNAIFNMKAGQISDPIIRNDGYHIFKVIDKKSVSNLVENDINQVKNILFKQKLQIAAKSHLMDLRKKSFIEINKKILVKLSKQ